MCGIAGFLGAGDRGDLEAMTGRLAHRGPDAEGFFIAPDRGLHLGHRRLAILDLGGGGQPMSSADGRFVVVFNGEIYNHAELRVRLSEKGHRFLTDHSDTEVLLHGWREWGEELPGHLNGMWAFAIWDLDRRSLFLQNEMMKWVYKADAAVELEAVFEADKKDCREITMKEVEAYTWGERLNQRTSRLMADVL